MKVMESITCFNVTDVARASAFLTGHFGFTEMFTAEGFASLAGPGEVRVALHRRGLEFMPDKFRDQPSSGVILAFQIADLDAEEQRLRAEGVNFLLPLTTQEWGERALLVEGPDGIVVELCDFPDGAPA